MTARAMWHSSWRTMVQMLFAPARVADALGERPAVWQGGGAVLTLGVLWAAFSLVLYLRGHAPSFVLLPIPRPAYYLWQSLFVVPVTLASWWVLGSVAAWVAGAARGPARDGVIAVLGVAYAAPLVFGFLAVDVVLFAAFGFEAMGRAIRFYAPLAPLWGLWVGTLAVRRRLSVSTARAWLGCAVGFVAMAPLGAVFLR